MKQVKIRPYSVSESTYMLQASELYSGLGQDPLVDATIHAMDNLAFNKDGEKLTFSIIPTIFAIDCVDREKEFLEDIPVAIRRWSQKINVQIIVWNNEKDKEVFDNSDNVFLI